MTKKAAMNNFRHILTTLLLMTGVVCARGEGIFDNLTYYGRLGYSLGGTAPIGMPETIRSLSKYTIKANITIGLDAYKPLGGKWGIMGGFHIETKGMGTDARVKNYSMEMRQGNESLKGVFTGQVVSNVETRMVTLPLQATYDVSGKVRLKLGPYFSYLLSNKFDGYAYDGYLRVGNPTGEKVEMGTDKGSRGNYDFSDYMRKWQFGVDVGADWYFSRHFGAYLDMSWGLSGVFKQNFKTIEQTLYPIYGTIGITYKLN